MSNTYRTAFAGSFASGVVMSPAPNLPVGTAPDPESPDAVDDSASRNQTERGFERLLRERGGGKLKAR